MATKKKRSTKKAPPKRRAGKKVAHETDVAAAEEKFVSDLLIRGEAALPDSQGHLPTNATHEIVEEKEGELPKVVRRTFKIY